MGTTEWVGNVTAPWNGGNGESQNYEQYMSELIHILNLSLIFVKLIDVIIPIKTGIPDIQEHP